MIKNLKNRIGTAVLGGSALLVSTFAAASGVSGTDEFNSFYTTVDGWSRGGLGTGMAITSLLMGSGIAVTKNSPMPALAGVGVAAFLKWGPGIITNLVTNGALI